MDTNKIKNKFVQADQFLESAKNELNRPAEDVVSYMVCRSYSISHYLQALLLKQAIKFGKQDSVETLLEKCCVIDDRFNNFDLSAITTIRDDEYNTVFDEMPNGIDFAEHAKQLIGK